MPKFKENCIRILISFLKRFYLFIKISLNPLQSECHLCCREHSFCYEDSFGKGMSKKTCSASTSEGCIRKLYSIVFEKHFFSDCQAVGSRQLLAVTFVTTCLFKSRYKWDKMSVLFSEQKSNHKFFYDKLFYDKVLIIIKLVDVLVYKC